MSITKATPNPNNIDTQATGYNVRVGRLIMTPEKLVYIALSILFPLVRT